MKHDNEDRKQRILVVCQHYWPESFRINDISDFLANDKGCEVDVLCGIPNYPKGEFVKGYSYFKNRQQQHNGVNIRRVFEIPRGSNTNMRIFLNYISFPIASIFHIPRLLTKKYDKILIYQLSPVMMAFTGLIIGKIKKTETTMYVLDLWPENLFSVLPVKNKILRDFVTYLSHWHYRQADKIVALSKTMQARLIEITNKSKDQIVVLPQAAESLYEIPIHDKKLENRFNKTFNVVFTGNISPAQSFNTMIEAAEILKNEGLKNKKWIIVGDGMSRGNIEKEVSARNLNDVFIFEGQKNIEDIPKYTAIADVLVGCLVKSKLLEATIPAKVMSYIASAKPIVLAMDGEVQDLINNEIRCGYAGNTEDSLQLAHNIRRVYELPTEQIVEMGQLASKYHHKYYQRNIILNRLYKLIFSNINV